MLYEAIPSVETDIICSGLALPKEGADEESVDGYKHYHHYRLVNEHNGQGSEWCDDEIMCAIFTLGQ